MDPTIGRIVIVKGLQSNGSDEHPAVVTRVWNPTYLNVMVLPDAGQPQAVTSIAFFQTRDEAVAALPTAAGGRVAYWPPRA